MCDRPSDSPLDEPDDLKVVDLTAERLKRDLAKEVSKNWTPTKPDGVA